MRLVCVLTLGVLAAGCATPAGQISDPSIQAPGGPVPADFSLCDLNPAPSACSIPDLELTAATARERIDAEYARLQKAAPGIARKFAIDSFSAADLRTGSADYRLLRDRAWKAAFEASEEDGRRYFMLRDLGKAAFKAGDRPMARETIRQRRILIRSRPKDQEWDERVGVDVSHSLPREQAWQDTVFDAASFGEPDLAISVLNEAVPESQRDSYDYLSSLAAVREAAGQYQRLEALARKIIETAPYRDGKLRDFGEDEKVGGHIFLIISLLKQGKEIGDLADQLLYHVQDVPVSLWGHAKNFFYTADGLIDASPEIARRFLELGQETNRIGGGGTANFFSRTLEVDICKALRDDACLLEMAKAQEAKMGIPRDDFWSVAVPYAIAGDFVSLKRLFRSVTPEHCAARTYPAVAERLKLDNHLGAIPGWLRDWVVCQISKDPNYRLFFVGLPVNDWSEIARTYVRLSRWQSDAGLHRAALNSAKIALLLAIETQSTWNHTTGFYRALSLGRIYSYALGALVRAEAAVVQR